MIVIHIVNVRQAKHQPRHRQQDWHWQQDLHEDINSFIQMLLLEFQQWQARTRSHTRTHRNRLSHIRRVACREKTMEKRSKDDEKSICKPIDCRPRSANFSPRTPLPLQANPPQLPFPGHIYAAAINICLPSVRNGKKNQESGLHIELRHGVLVDIIRSLAVQPPHCGF